MYKRFSIVVFFLLIIIELSAQITQHGIVYEYNGEQKKNALQGVELLVENAGSTTSKSNGTFTLVFRNRKSGDKVICKRIEKLGYEIFNKDALEQWYISTSDVPYKIIMCRSDKFKLIRDKYNAISSKSYAKQEELEIIELEKERYSGKLSEEEYQKESRAIHSYYQERLEELDSYVDKFARIDLSELSAKELFIVKLVQQGQIEEAIKMYEEEDFLVKYENECKDINNLLDSKNKLKDSKYVAVEARDSIYQSIQRQIDTYILAGGRENYSKATMLHRDVALADTTNIEPVFDYAQFLETQHKYNESIRFWNIVLHLMNDYNSVMAFNHLSRNYSNISAFELALWCADKGLELRKSYYEISHSSSHKAGIANDENLIGTILLSTNRPEDAIAHFDNAIELRKELLDEEFDLSTYVDYASAVGNLGLAYKESGDTENALAKYLECRQIHEKIAKEDSKRNLHEYSYVNNNIGTLYLAHGEFEEALRYLTLSNKQKEVLYRDNPERYCTDYAMSFMNMANTFREKGEYNQAKGCYERSCQLMEEDYDQTNNYSSEYATAFCNLGRFFHDSNNHEESIPYYKKGIDCYSVIFNRDSIYLYEYEFAALNYARSLVMCQKFDVADSILDLSLMLIHPIFKKEGFSNKVKSDYADYNYIKGRMHLAKNEIEDAKKHLSNSAMIYDDLLENDSAYFYQLLISKNFIGCAYELSDTLDVAEKLYLSAYDDIEFLFQKDSVYYRHDKSAILSSLGNLYYKQKDYDKAIDVFSRANRLYHELVKENEALYLPILTNNQNYLAYSYLNLNNNAEAIAIIKEAISIDPKNANLYDSLGEFLMLSGNDTEALRMWEKVLNMNPDFLEEHPSGTVLYNALKNKNLIQ